MDVLTTKPFLKWAGGKQALVEPILSRFPSTFHCYFEPFLGGGSILLASQPKLARANDLNGWLIATYTAIRDDWEKVAKILDSIPNTKEDYYLVRQSSNKEKNRWRRAAYFVYLNKTCFRGLYRVNRDDEFNVPYGAYDRRYYSPENLSEVAKAIEEVEFDSLDFEAAIATARSGDFVYFDPPYHKIGGFSDFNRYTANQFREAEHERLALLCRQLDKNGVRWLCSNSDTAFVRKLYTGFLVEELSARRDINLKSNKRTVKELLISNY